MIRYSDKFLIRMTRLITFVSLFLCSALCAQNIQADLTLPPESLEAIEDFFQNTSSEGDFDFNTLFEQLEAYLERPLNINRAEEADLRSLGLLTDVQILNFIR